MSNPNSNPWAPYDSYTDCSQGVCNIYCPQWCYLIFPPPPPFFLDQDDDSSSSSSSTFSPLLIALIGILASAFVLVSYYTLVSKYCHRRRQNSSDDNNNNNFFSTSSSSAAEPRQQNAAGGGGGLNDALIKSITVYKYRKSDGFGFVDCSVCLSEFEEEESLRLLPKCNHAFHLPCIDTWLKSHSNCPLCRAFVTGANPSAVADDNNSSSAPPPRIAVDSGNRGGETGDSFVDLETGSGNNIHGGGLNPQPPEEEEERRETKDEVTQQPIRRSVSLNSSVVVSIADVLREIEDNGDERDEESGGVGTSRRRRREEGEKTIPLSTAESQRSGGVSNFLVRSTVAMKRSVSTGRFVMCDQARNYRLPN